MRTTRGRFKTLAAALVLLFGVSVSGGLSTAVAQDSSPVAEASEFFDPAEYAEQLRLRDVTPEGPADQPWIQALEPEYVDTAQYVKEGPHKICFSNAGVNNPWRVVGYTTMQAEVELHPEIAEFVHVDAEGSDEKQITDIQDLLGQ